MLPDRVSNPGPLTYESGALPIALCGSARLFFFFFLKREVNILINYTKLISSKEINQKLSRNP